MTTAAYAGIEDPRRHPPRGYRTPWHQERRDAITLALLPDPRYRHAFQLGCSTGALTAQLARRCDRVTAMDVADAALRSADARLRRLGCRDRVTLYLSSRDASWPPGPFDLLMLSGVAYCLEADALATVLCRECPRLQWGAKVVAAHCRRPGPDHPLTGDAAHAVIADTPGLTSIARYGDRDFVVEVFDTGDAGSP
ncbi:class I SAM-dependent methyltransferase [Mycobacterium sp. 1081908.1]|uniref:class I SAM-dependent methyltransferase n=1 Tax=Mycobacterium sp. 1081908.1 TaxID=1834066 RepID=UPI000AFB6E2F|nr:class I SAM-dependent methyltransferase [Mycobacterium sp. 1081908.1]